jgi:hypothetical protein
LAGPNVLGVLDQLVDYLTSLLGETVREVTVAAAVVRGTFAPMASGLLQT